jgi:NDP-sugar pyrophosphorylase family protein
MLLALARSGANHVVISTGYLADQFVKTLGSGDRFGLRLSYVPDGDEPSGTAGGVRNCLPLLGDRFLVVYGDSLLRVNPAEVVNMHDAERRLATMTVIRADLTKEDANCVVEEGLVTAYSKVPPPARATHVDYGMLVLERTALCRCKSADLSDLQAILAANRDVSAFTVSDTYVEIGTPSALTSADAELSLE